MAARLQWPDYLILAAFLVISLGIGLYHSLTGGRQKTTAEFIMANRRLSIIPTAISLLVSFQSAITLIGFTAEIYVYGVQYLIFMLLAPYVGLVVTERIIVPWLYPLKLVSVFEYLERRFSHKSVRIFGAVMGILNAVCYMGVCMYAPSAALEAATGLPLSVSVPVLSSVAVAYTALGGMRAVIWTDVFQFLIMVGGYVAILVKGLMIVGGFSKVFELAGNEGRLIWADVSPDPRVRHTVWGFLFGMMLSYATSFGLSQPSVQRYSAVKSLCKARTTLLINIPPLLILNALACTMGLIVLAYYSAIQCDPMVNNDVNSQNQLLPFFVVHIFADAPGFSGVFLSTLYGASLSSISSALSGSAANIWEDILQWKLAALPESRKALINRMLVIVLGAVAAGIAFLAASIPGPIVQVVTSIISSFSAPMLGLFLLGGLFKLANWKGTLCGGFAGVAFTMWLSFGSMSISHKHEMLPPVSTKGCSAGNFTFTPEPINNYTSSEMLLDFADVQFSQTLQDSTTMGIIQKFAYQGLQNFYAISYTWFVLLGASVTFIVGIVASLIMRDRELEKRVDDSLLLRFRDIFTCECRDDEDAEKKDYLSDSTALDIEKEALKNSSNGSCRKENIDKISFVNGDHLKKLTNNNNNI